jgi:hypothetical protein
MIEEGLLLLDLHLNHICLNIVPQMCLLFKLQILSDKDTFI